MNNQICTNEHQYGPFKEIKNNYYRICKICNKKTIYPKDEDIKKEIEKQLSAKMLLEIITKQKINIIKKSDNFLKLIACLLDNISYLYLNETEIKDTLLKITNLNNYFNQNQENYQLIQDTLKYLNEYFNGENNEEQLLKLDNLYNKLVQEFDKQILKQIEAEENNTIEIEDNQIDLKNTSSNNLELLEEIN
jgi:hypothetical protein